MKKDFSPAISVIVPVYNVENYLRKCVDSILSQTFTDFELILVDDGSPDNCGKICDEYENSDCRVKAIHKINGGQSSARNAGLDVATGKYVYFCDSDDYISPELLEKVYYKAENGGFDQVKFNTNNTDGDKITGGSSFLCGDFHLDNIEAKKSFICEKFLQYKIGWETCIALFKKSIIDEHNIRFYDGINLAEDTCFNLLHLYYSNAVAVLPDRLYYYLLRGDSTTGQAKAKNRLYEKIKLFSFVEKSTPNELESILPHFFSTITSGGLWEKSAKIKKKEYIQYKTIIDNLEEKDLFKKWSKTTYFSLKKYNKKKYGVSLGGKINAANKLLFNENYFTYSVKWGFYSIMSFPERIINKIKRIIKGKNNG